MNRGSAREKNGRFYFRARYGRAKRIELRIPWAKSLDEANERAAIIGDAAEALIDVGRRDLVKESARELAEATTEKKLAVVQKTIALIVAGAKKVGATRETTFGQWARRYTSGELAKDFPDYVRAKDYSDDVSRLNNYILPLLEDVLVSEFKLAHALEVMTKLPAMSEGNRRHVGQVMGHLMHLAVFPGQIIPASPLPRGWLPRVKKRKHYSCLFPREEAKFLGCEDIAESFRLFCGVLDREGMREAELLDCEWWQWNFEEGTFLATKTKGGDPRMWAVRPDTARAMKMWRERTDAAKPFAYVAALGDRTKLAHRFRQAVRKAGITRAELFEATEHTGALRVHDLRATFVTVSLAEGKSEAWIRDRTAHKSTAMIDRYRRQARQFAELKLGSLVDLVSGLGWGKAGGRTTNGGSNVDGNAIGSAHQAEVAEWQTQRTQNPLSGPETSPDELNHRGNATCRDDANGASPGLPPPPSRRPDPLAADLVGVLDSSPSPALVDGAVGLAALRSSDALLEDAFTVVAREVDYTAPEEADLVHRDDKPANVKPPAKASPRELEEPKKRARGGRS